MFVDHKLAYIIILVIILNISALNASDDIPNLDESFSYWIERSNRGLSFSSYIENDYSSKLALLWLIILYRKTVSDIDGRNCRMLPHCTQYGVEAVKYYGVLYGLPMTLDRIIRCGRVSATYQPIVGVNYYGERVVLYLDEPYKPPILVNYKKNIFAQSIRSISGF